MSKRGVKWALVAAGGAVGVWALGSRSKEPQHARNWHGNGHLKYPASANYPDLSKHNNHMADALTPAVSICIMSLIIVNVYINSVDVVKGKYVIYTEKTNSNCVRCYDNVNC